MRKPARIAAKAVPFFFDRGMQGSNELKVTAIIAAKTPLMERPRPAARAMVKSPNVAQPRSRPASSGHRNEP